MKINNFSEQTTKEKRKRMNTQKKYIKIKYDYLPSLKSDTVVYITNLFKDESDNKMYLKNIIDLQCPDRIVDLSTKYIAEEHIINYLTSSFSNALSIGWVKDCEGIN